MKLFIVEDDKNIGISIKKIIEEHFKTIEVFMFDDGINAVDNLVNYTPDILLTDIRMPGKDGFEVSKAVLQQNPVCKIIMISAYSEKEYFKSAIDLHVEAFLEKPFETDKFIKVLGKAIDSLLMEEEIKDFKRHKESEILLKFITKPFSEETEKSLAELNSEYSYLNESGINHVVLLFEFFCSNELSTFDSRLEICRVMLRKYRSFIIAKTENVFLALVSMDKNTNSEYVKNKIKITINEIFQKEESKNFNVYIGKCAADKTDVYDSYTSATLLFQQGFILGKGNVVIAAEDESYKKDDYDYHKFLSEFDEHLSNYNFEKCTKCLEVFYNHVKSNYRDIIISYVKSSCIQVYYSLINAFRKNDILPEIDYRIESVAEAESLDEVMCFLKKMIDFYYKVYQGKKNIITHAIISYINDNYADQALSLKKISDHTGYSIQHICNIFKKDMGTTINNFILLTRINKAKIMLLESDYTQAEIADKIGMSDAGYFSKKFKAITGYNAGEFKNRGKL